MTIFIGKRNLRIIYKTRFLEILSLFCEIHNFFSLNTVRPMWVSKDPPESAPTKLFCKNENPRDLAFLGAFCHGDNLESTLSKTDFFLSMLTYLIK
jgi:hypothetical protein